MSKRSDARAGALAAFTSLAVSELAAGLFTGFPPLAESMGDLVIDTAPPPVKDFAISVFGVYDKLVLIIGMVVVSVLLGAAVGSVARRRPWVAPLVFGGFGLLAAYAGARDPRFGPGAAASAGGLAVIVGLWVLSFLQRSRSESADPIPGRREFLRSAGSVAALALAAGGVGRFLLERAKRVAAGREEVLLPHAGETLAALPAAASLPVEGITPIIIPNQDFYRIDTALSIPQVDLSTWKLAVTGMVERPYEIDYSDLLDMEMVERYVTLSCVSNEVGGGLVGNAKWMGVPLRTVLELAGLGSGAEQVVGRSVDGFTVGFPLEAALDGREALVAVGMNGEPLPLLHGFPARLVVAGLYGYVSATKWLTEIELTTWDGFDAYWIERRWSKEGPIKTQSRIDVPVPGSKISAERRMIAGVAWAPSRGISKVEVSVDGLEWMEAELSEPLSNDAWRQWAVPFQFTPGTHTIRVRATDGTGSLQSEAITPPAPSGATGWHTISVRAEA